MLDLLIRNGQVVTPQGAGAWEVAVQDGKIAAVAAPGTFPEAIQQGFPSFKVFTTDVLPPHPKRPSNRLDFGRLQYAMEKVAPRGGIMVVHAEDHDVVQFMYERFREEGRMDGANLPLVHNKV